jgi:hypothetical protein
MLKYRNESAFCMLSNNLGFSVYCCSQFVLHEMSVFIVVSVAVSVTLSCVGMMPAMGGAQQQQLQMRGARPAMGQQQVRAAAMARPITGQPAVPVPGQQRAGKTMPYNLTEPVRQC